MKKENLPIAVIIGVFLVAAAILFFTIREKSDLQLCRDIFWDLLNGKQSVQKYIDWEKFQAIGINVGELYNQLPNASEQADFRKQLIKSLSMNFKLVGGKPEAFVDWREVSKEGENTVVSAYYTDKQETILFTLTGYEKKKLISMQWAV
ncbi:MAG: hypothetical protein ABH914_04035, partial [Candidatus Omnitrophota bacterium]